MNYFCPFKQRRSFSSLVSAITESTEQRCKCAPSCETESSGEEHYYVEWLPWFSVNDSRYANVEVKRSFQGLLF